MMFMIIYLKSTVFRITFKSVPVITDVMAAKKKIFGY